MLKKISSLGKIIDKKEQSSIYGGEFCVWHCIDECYSKRNTEACIQNCIDLGGQL